MTYAIAQYLTDEQKAAALAVTYRPLTKGKGRNPLPRSKDGCCPLGVALRATDPMFHGVPTAGNVACQLTGIEYAEWVGYPEYVAAQRFIDDWDAGMISDLAEALGVQP